MYGLCYEKYILSYVQLQFYTQTNEKPFFLLWDKTNNKK